MKVKTTSNHALTISVSGADWLRVLTGHLRTLYGQNRDVTVTVSVMTQNHNTVVTKPKRRKPPPARENRPAWAAAVQDVQDQNGRGGRAMSDNDLERFLRIGSGNVYNVRHRIHAVNLNSPLAHALVSAILEKRRLRASSETIALLQEFTEAARRAGARPVYRRKKRGNRETRPTVDPKSGSRALEAVIAASVDTAAKSDTRATAAS